MYLLKIQPDDSEFKDFWELVELAFARISSLELLAYGDFSYNNRFKGRNFLLARNNDPSRLSGRTIQHCRYCSVEFEEVCRYTSVHDPKEFLEACPVSRLMPETPDGQAHFPSY